MTRGAGAHPQGRHQSARARWVSASRLAGAGRRDRPHRRRAWWWARPLSASDRGPTRAPGRTEIVAEVTGTLPRSLAGSTHAAASGKVRRMNWITNLVRPQIKNLMAGKGGRRRYAGKSLEQMPVLRRDDLPPRSGGQSPCLPQLRPSYAHRPGRAFRLYLRRQFLQRIAAAARGRAIRCASRARRNMPTR